MERIIEALSMAQEWELLIATLRENGVPVLITAAGLEYMEAAQEPAAV